VWYGMHSTMVNGNYQGEETASESVATVEAIRSPLGGVRVTGNYTYGQETLSNCYRAVRVQYSKFPGVLENFALGNLNRDQLKERINMNQFQVVNLFGDYERNINEHYFKVMAGFNQEVRTFKTLSATGNELLSEDLNDLNLVSGEHVLGGGASEW